MSKAYSPPANAPVSPAVPIPKATIYLDPGIRRRRIEARDVAWELKPLDRRCKDWQVFITFMLPKARKRQSLCVAPYPGNVVIVEGWGHPEIPPSGKSEIGHFAGDPVYPPMAEDLAAFFREAVEAGTMKILADFSVKRKTEDELVEE